MSTPRDRRNHVQVLSGTVQDTADAVTKITFESRLGVPPVPGLALGT